MLLTLIYGSTDRIFPSHIKSAPGIEEQPVVCMLQHINYIISSTAF